MVSDSKEIEAKILLRLLCMDLFACVHMYTDVYVYNFFYIGEGKKLLFECLQNLSICLCVL